MSSVPLRLPVYRSLAASLLSAFDNRENARPVPFPPSTTAFSRRDKLVREDVGPGNVLKVSYTVNLLYRAPRDTHHSCLPVARRPYVEPIDQVSFGQMDVKCDHCNALHWHAERLRRSSASSPLFSRCCHHGKVRHDLLQDPPDPLLSWPTCPLIFAGTTLLR